MPNALKTTLKDGWDTLAVEPDHGLRALIFSRGGHVFDVVPAFEEDTGEFASVLRFKTRFGAAAVLWDDIIAIECYSARDNNPELHVTRITVTRQPRIPAPGATGA